ncbi:MAG: hypothetical protein A2177_04835 [Spirochaetes bacterium RBG_13_68_11]|nr:MAG: hypothetical protein A2177_04835 [Spirochaetes bacterium RBG_13_68_11]
MTDSVTGEPIEDVTVVFGSYATATNVAGFYSIEVPTTVTSVTGTFVAYKGLEYAFRACAGISVDPTTDPVYDFDLAPNDPSGYSEVNLSGKIFDNTATELGDSTDVWFFFANENSGRWRAAASYSSGYSVATKATGSNCFMAVGTDFTFYQIGQNLSVDLTNHDLTQPPAIDYNSVTLNGTTGTMFFGNLLVSDSVSCVGYLSGFFIMGPTTTLDVYNPENYPLQWYVVTGESDTPAPGLTTIRCSIGTTSYSDTITLPAAYTGPAPTGIVNGASVTWNGSTLTFTPATGANFYMLVLGDDTGHYGSLQVSSAASVTFPSGFVTSVLELGAGWDLVAWPVYSSAVTPALLLIGSLIADPSGQPPDKPQLFEFGTGMIQFSGVTKTDAIP